MKINNIADAIGETPLLKIDEKIHGIKNVNLYAKLELLNPFGSLKDRVAKNILEVEKAKGKTVIESSSGNTAKALTGLCNSQGLEFKTISNRIKEPEIRQILQIMGAKIDELPGLSECPDPNDPNDPVQTIEKIVKKTPDKFFHTNQYFNEKNIQAHHQTGNEIIKDLKQVDYYFGYLGTCGSTRGVGEILKEKSNSKIIAVVTKNGEYVPGGRNENELFETGFYKPEFYDDMVLGTVQKSIDGMLELVRKCGIPCGPTSGLTYSCLIEYLKKQEIEEEINVVFICCDRIEPYINYIKKYRKEVFENDENDENQKNKISSKLDFSNLDHDKVLYSSEIEQSEIEENSLIIDIRSNFSFNVKHIPNSINIQQFMFEDMLKQKNCFPKNKQIILICPKGTITKKYVAYLEQLDYDIHSLKGGILNYKF